jgi:hypothetical protein
VVPTASTTVLDLCLRFDNSTQQCMTDHSITWEDLGQKGRAAINLHINRALEPFNRTAGCSCDRAR